LADDVASTGCGTTGGAPSKALRLARRCTAFRRSSSLAGRRVDQDPEASWVAPDNPPEESLLPGTDVAGTAFDMPPPCPGRSDARELRHAALGFKPASPNREYSTIRGTPPLPDMPSGVSNADGDSGDRAIGRASLVGVA